MTHRFTRRFRVRYYELDVLGHVNHVTFVRYMQEAAIEASTALGFSPDWYRERDQAWVVRRLSVRYYAQLTYGDEVEVATWISGMRGVWSTREYVLTRGRDGLRVARARAEWVYVDGKSLQPTRCPDGWAEAIPPSRELEDLSVRLGNTHQIDGARRYARRHRVQFHDLDTARHVNHAAYLHWVEESYFEALRVAGYPLERTRQEGWTMLPEGQEIQYFAPAFDNDNVEVMSWVCEIEAARVVWTHEVYNADTRKLLARVFSVRAFVTPEGKPSGPTPTGNR